MKKSSLRKEGFILAHSFRVQFITAGMLGQQELDVPHHMVTTVRKQRAINASSAYLLSLLDGDLYN